MMDQLEITALCVRTYIGVHAWEQRILQPLLIDLIIPLNCSSNLDELQTTVDYDTLCGRITDFVESNSFALIETVANQVAALVKKEFAIPEITVRISKPNAIQNASNISIQVRR